MSAQVWLLGGTIVTALAGLGGTYLLIRQQGRQSKTTDAQQIIDQLQENAKMADEKHQRELAGVESRHTREMSEVRSEIAALRREVATVKSRDLTLFDYASTLRWHIDQGKGPPPPPWPDSLMYRPD